MMTLMMVVVVVVIVVLVMVVVVVVVVVVVLVVDDDYDDVLRCCRCHRLQSRHRLCYDRPRECMYVYRCMGMWVMCGADDDSDEMYIKTMRARVNGREEGK